MVAVITQQEIDRLRAPFPLEAHSIREGNKTKSGKIQWFTYVEKPEVENRLNEVFPGEWGSTVPVLTVMGNSVAATIGITIRGITRGNTGEDSNGTEKAKGATTDAFRRAAADWGIAKYLWEMDLKIYTDDYKQGDWDARDAREKEAFNKLAAWFKKKFQNVTKLPPPSTQERPISNVSDQNVPAPQNAQNGLKTPVERLAGNGAPPEGAKKRIGGDGKWEYDLPALMSHPDLNAAYPQYTHRANAIKLLHEGGYFEAVSDLSAAVKIVLDRPDKKEQPA